MIATAHFGFWFNYNQNSFVLHNTIKLHRGLVIWFLASKLLEESTIY